MGLLDWAALSLGALLIFQGIGAIRRREADVPERWEGDSAVRLGWLWIVLCSLFVLAVVFDIGFLKAFFRLFLEAAN